MGRRRALAAGGAALLAGLAGCGGSDGGRGSSDGAALDSHPAGRDLADQPFLGPPPGEATGTIVAFEDPSCPTCARFERETVPEIRANLVEPGRATFAFRGVPVVYPWGEPAARALEATFARDPDAFWALVGHYFGSQSSFRGGDEAAVLDGTAAFLDAETGVSGAAVAEAVRAGAADAAVDADLSAGEDAGVSATPTLFLFRDGVLQTRVQGNVGYTVVEGALGL